MKRSIILLLIGFLAIIGLSFQAFSSQPVIKRTSTPSRSKEVQPETFTQQKKSKPIKIYTPPKKQSKTVQKTNKSKPVSCPQGTTPTGGGGCKMIPTGCHLDEHTPMDECY